MSYSHAATLPKIPSSPVFLFVNSRKYQISLEENESFDFGIIFPISQWHVSCKEILDLLPNSL